MAQTPHFNGTTGNDVISGSDAADKLTGGKGDDIYIVNHVQDEVVEKSNEGTDTVLSSVTYTLSNHVDHLTLTGAGALNGTGNSLNNVLTGNNAANVLDGRGGADAMHGKGGDDTYVVDNAGDTAVESANEGADTVLSSVSFALGANIENLTLTGSSAVTGTGNNLNNVLTGNGAANILDGGIGADAMAGGAGNDTYVVDDSGDSVTEAANQGSDTVKSSITYELGAHVENLVLTGTGAIDGKGNSLGNALTGNSGANVLDGGAGGDAMAGGAGNDTYVVDNWADDVTEAAGQGIDTVVSSVSHVLSANVENLTLTSTSFFSGLGVGNTLDNVITGTAGLNILSGRAGNDTLSGNGGLDFIDGGSGSDTAVFSGTFADYDITPFHVSLGYGGLDWSRDGDDDRESARQNPAPLVLSGVIVTDLRDGAPDGKDFIRHVETLRFSDRPIYLDGRNNEAILSADTRSLTETNAAADLNANGQLTIVDFDGGETFLAQSNTAGQYGRFSIGTDGAWTYAADSAHDAFAAGQTYVEIFDVQSFDGTHTSVTITITGTNDGPVITTFDGQGQGSTVEAGNLDNGSVVAGDPDASGTLTASDVDAGATRNWTGNASGTYGAFAIEAGGAWTYTLDNAIADALDEGDVVTDTFTATVTDDQGATASQQVTITVSGTNDKPVITGGVVTGAVTEDGPGAATGRLTAVDPDAEAEQLWSVVGGTPGGNADFHFRMDRLTIVKNGATFFQDDFADGVAPPGGPGGTSSYNVSNNLHLVESNGRLLLDSNSTIPLPGVGTAEPVVGASGVFRSNINPATPELGLRSDDNFSVSATFDLVVPDSARESYSIRFSDRLVGGTGTPPDQPGNSVVDLGVFKRSDGVVVVRLREPDFSTDTVKTLEQIELAAPPGADQIRLNLAHSTTATGQVVASFDYLSGGIPVGSHIFGAVGHIFENENWTRVQFSASAPATNGSELGGIYGDLHVDASGAWTYALDDARVATQALAQGEHRADTFAVRVADMEGASDSTTVSVDVTGTNDAPIMQTPQVSRALGEDLNVTGPGMLAASGDAVFSDVDLIDTHAVTAALTSAVLSGGSAVPAALSSLLSGALAVTLNGVATGDGSGELHWDFALANAAVQFLAAGQTLALSYDVIATDNIGASAAQGVKITITGTNDAPEITSAVQSSALTEAANNSGDEISNVMHQATGTLAFTEVDLADAHSVSVNGNGAAGYRGTLSASLGDLATGDGSGAIAWTFAVSDGALDDLAQGEVLTQTYSVVVSDGQGGTAAQDVVITLVGAADNSPPVAVDDAIATDEDSSVTFNVLANDTDADTGQSLSVVDISAPSNAALGSLQSLGNGQFSFTPIANASGIAAFTYRTYDGQANSADTATVSITVNPVNDAPVITSNGGAGSASVSVVENTTAVTSVNASDADALDSKSFSLTGGADQAQFTINASSGALAFAAAPNFEAPADAGANNVYEVQVTVTDSGGLTATQALAVSVTDVSEVFANLELSTLNGVNGFKLSGVAATDQSGYSVSSAGDVNGDGFDDLIVGAVGADPNGSNSGASYVVFGGAAAVAGGNLNLSTLNGVNGFKLSGVAVNDVSGNSVSSAGDVNGDGFDDLIVGARAADPNGSNSGASYVVFGGAAAAWGNLNLSTLNGVNGFRLSGVAAGDESGWSVSSAGDVNGDGFDDLIVGSRFADPNGLNSGASYVVFGGATAVAGGNLNLSTLNGVNGFKLSGVAASDLSGWSVSSAGDVNGDGFDDVIVGATNADPNGDASGASYVVFGGAGTVAGGNLNLSTLNGVNGFRLAGVAAYDQSGISVSSAGDVNGDGFDDVIVGARTADPNGDASGASYVVFGGAGAVAGGILNLSTLNGVKGFKISGVAAYDQSGISVSSAGDVNGDGFDDLIIGARGADPNFSFSGASYVVFGGAATVAAGNLNLSTLNGVNGFKLAGVAAFDQSGYSVSSAGDVNGDGFDDLIVGARTAVTRIVANSGASYVLFGSNFTGAVTHLGTAAADTLTGTAAAESFVAGLGSDTLVGNGGADAFQGGAGDDVIVVGAGLPFDVDGGSGLDTVNVDAIGAFIDLSSLDSARFHNIEKIDLAGAAANTLVLDKDAVLRIAEANGNAFGVNAILVKGDAQDQVTLAGAWTRGATLENPFGESGSFVTYTSGAATVLLEQEVQGHPSPPALDNIDLATLDGVNGFKLSGAAVGDQSGASVSSAGDVNGDGFDDLIVGAWRSSPNGFGSGASFVVLGGAAPAGGNLNLATLNGINGFKLSGVASGDESGWSVSGAGDVNGDGFDDLVVGAWRADPLAAAVDGGASYVVFGGAAAVAGGVLDLSNLNGVNGFKLSGVGTRDLSGSSVSGAGDVNGDGFDDLIVGAQGVYANGQYAGASYVVFGGAATVLGGNLDLSTLNGVNGFKLYGVENGGSGGSVSGAGDVNGDGFDDVIVGARVTFANGFTSGASYVVFGGATAIAGGNLDLSTLNGVNGFKLSGVQAYDRSGYSVSSAGDVNGDGFDDLIVGAPIAPNGAASGASYVVFGGAATGAGGNLNLSTLNGVNGFRLSGETAGDRSGWSVSGAGDVNGDGFDDLIVGAWLADPNGETSGASYVVFGGPMGVAGGNLNLSTLNGINGFQLSGAAVGDRSGWSVSGAGDVNGDGFDDLIVGAPAADPNGNYSGVSYVVFGGNFSGAVTYLGTAAEDTLTGTAAAETFVSGLGSDTLVGNGGADAFQGGAGDDVIVVGAGLPFDVDGGSGLDTVNVDAIGAFIDLSSLDSARFHNIEKIDLAGAAANTLVLDKDAVLRIADTNGNAFGVNAILVKGDAQDQVTLAGAWTRGATLENPFGESGSFVTYTSGAATVLLEQEVQGHMSLPALAEVNLSTLNGLNGFKLSGVAASDQSGWSVSGGGDVNGDGFEDLIVGARLADPNGSVSGASYVVFGGAAAVAGGDLNLSSLNGTNGFKLSGVAAYDQSGYSVSSAGDVNGDGFDDLIVGAIGGYTGAAYVVFGGATAVAGGNLNLSSLNGTNGFKLSGVAGGDFTGESVSSAGDVNGDGFDDLIVGAFGAIGAHAYSTGASYVVFGGTAAVAGGNLNLSSLNGINGFKLSGVAPGDQTGRSLSSAGDVNGDGFDDLIVGAFGADANGGDSGASYVVFGAAAPVAGGDLDLSTLDGVNGFKLSGVAASDLSGYSVGGAGDVNGDGFDDLIVGARDADPNGSESGASYVVFGGAVAIAGGNLDLATLNGVNGFKLSGVAASDFSGISVSSAGDVNADGFDDLIVGARNADPHGSNSGASYVVFGGAAAVPGGTLELSTLNGLTGFKVSGVAADDISGWSVSGAGDVNGDGFDDLIVGAVGADTSATDAGASYVVFGGNSTGAVTHLGTAAGDALTGTAAAESFVGGLGNDILVGNGGADALQGGAGDDVLAINDLGFFKIAGGSGVDTLRLDGSGLALNLTVSANSKVSGIERIDLTGSGNHTLTLNLSDVLGLSDSTNEVFVNGGAGDSVTILGSGWSTTGAETHGGISYNHYMNGVADLLVEHGVSVL